MQQPITVTCSSMLFTEFFAVSLHLCYASANRNQPVMYYVRSEEIDVPIMYFEQLLHSLKIRFNLFVDPFTEDEKLNDIFSKTKQQYTRLRQLCHESTRCSVKREQPEEAVKSPGHLDNLSVNFFPYLSLPEIFSCMTN
ncbi:hypothetical protein NPIL_699721 [Nephila pilipes]|uniref:Uncharacterized protein n=1 Tax=Nephila pilipes TaxID=299642 RepID=A0A8X6TAG8_NEPPI|nr:hypothetical protein NPIL_699721 [Nephila pilipes]